MSQENRPGDPQADVDNTPPPPVSNTLGWMIYWDWLIWANEGGRQYPQPFLAALLGAVGVPIFAVVQNDWSMWQEWLVAVGFTIFLPLRARRKRELQPVEADAYSGDIRRVQRGQIWPWLIGNSATDQISLDDEVITPGQTKFEQLFHLDSETIILHKTVYNRNGQAIQKVITLHRVRGVNDILALREWRRKQPQRLAERNNALQEKQLEVLKEMDNKLAMKPPRDWQIM